MFHVELDNHYTADHVTAFCDICNELFSDENLICELIRKAETNLSDAICHAAEASYHSVLGIVREVDTMAFYIRLDREKPEARSDINL